MTGSTRAALIACPVCGDTAVEKAPMAPRLGRSRGERAEPAERAARPETPAASPRRSRRRCRRPPSPAEMRLALQRAAQAGRDPIATMSARNSPTRRAASIAARPQPRGIYGEATPAESQALADEGIEVACIPWVPPNDA